MQYQGLSLARVEAAGFFNFLFIFLFLTPLGRLFISRAAVPDVSQPPPPPPLLPEKDPGALK